MPLHMQRIEVKTEKQWHLNRAIKSQVKWAIDIELFYIFILNYMKLINDFIFYLINRTVQARETQVAVIGGCGGGENWYNLSTQCLFLCIYYASVQLCK